MAWDYQNMPDIHTVEYPYKFTENKFKELYKDSNNELYHLLNIEYFKKRMKYEVDDIYLNEVKEGE